MESNIPRLRKRLDKIIRQLIGEMKSTVDRHFETGLYTLKFYSFYHLLKDLEGIETHKTIDSSLFTILKLHLIRTYRSTSQQWQPEKIKPIDLMNATRNERVRMV